MEAVKSGIHLKMQKEIQGIFSNMRGTNSENNLAGIFEVILRGRRGLLFKGFKVREYLKPLFDAFNISLPEYSVRGALREREELEHDIFHCFYAL